MSRLLSPARNRGEDFADCVAENRKPRKGQRMGRNPKTGEEAHISPRRVVVFKPSPILKQQMNAHPKWHEEPGE